MYSDQMSEEQRENRPETTYQDELNEAVGDGGGCAETWEAISELRADQSSSPINRRRFVKALATAGSAAAIGGSGIGSVAAKIQNKADQREVRKALQTEEVQTLLDELGNPPVQRGKAKRVTAKYEVEKVMEFTALTLPTPLGDIVYGTKSDGAVEASYLFGETVTKGEDNVPTGLAKKLPEPYQSMPTESDRKLVVTPDETRVFRTPTQSERRELAQITGLAEKETRGYIDSADDRFYVYKPYSEDENGNGQGGGLLRIDPSFTDGVYREISPEEFESATAEDVLTTQDYSCMLTCASCLGGLPGGCFVGCGGTCVGVVTVIGIIPCFLCVASVCNAALIACGVCADCADIQDMNNDGE